MRYFDLFLICYTIPSVLENKWWLNKLHDIIYEVMHKKQIEKNNIPESKTVFGAVSHLKSEFGDLRK